MEIGSCICPYVKRNSGTIDWHLKKAVARIATNENIYWDNALPKAVYWYRRKRMGAFGLFPYELLFGHPPSVTPIHSAALSNTACESSRIAESLAAGSIRAFRAIRKGPSPASVKIQKFAVGNLVLLAKGPVPQPNVKWLAL